MRDLQAELDRPQQQERLPVWHAMYVDNLRRYLLEIGTACGWHRLADIDRDAFITFLRQRAEGGASLRSARARMTAKSRPIWSRTKWSALRHKTVQ